MDIADPTRFTKITNEGWDGLALQGFPNPSNTQYLASRFGNPNYYVSKYAPPGWFQKWDSVGTQTDQNIRINQVRELIRTMAEEAITIPIWETHPQSASNGKVNDLDWCGKKNTNYWNPIGVWLSK
jgi:hypothetical protein